MYCFITIENACCRVFHCCVLVKYLTVDLSWVSSIFSCVLDCCADTELIFSLFQFCRSPKMWVHVVFLFIYSLLTIVAAYDCAKRLSHTQLRFSTRSLNTVKLKGLPFSQVFIVCYFHFIATPHVFNKAGSS